MGLIFSLLESTSVTTPERVSYQRDSVRVNLVIEFGKGSLSLYIG